MVYNHGREERKWRIWKEAEEKILRKHGVDESTIDEIPVPLNLTNTHRESHLNHQTCYENRIHHLTSINFNFRFQRFQFSFKRNLQAT